MDLKGSLVDDRVQIYLTQKNIDHLKLLLIDIDAPYNLAKIINGENSSKVLNNEKENVIDISLNDKDLQSLSDIKKSMRIHKTNKLDIDKNDNLDEGKCIKNSKSIDSTGPNLDEIDYSDIDFITTADLDWLYTFLKKQRINKNIPYLHEILEGSVLKLPENKIIKRNPELEARCVKLRAQQEAREYRKMTKGVDNVRMRFPEDSISYQLKQMNRQLIAIGQFIISIFAGFLFGFRGVEWMVGNLDFGFRLLLGVMCALVIALAEIYFLAKKLNEELNIPETIQLGGPPVFAERDPEEFPIKRPIKEHKD